MHGGYGEGEHGGEDDFDGENENDKLWEDRRRDMAWQRGSSGFRFG